MENNALKNANIDDYVIEELNYDDLEEMLTTKLHAELSELDFLEEEREKIGNPDSLGKTVLDEVWKQVTNQIGLDLTNETLNQEYDRLHPESYDDVSKNVLKDKRYKDATSEMKAKQRNGSLKDAYTGKDLKANDKANLDHVVSRKEIYENQRRKQAGLSTEDLANKSENLKATNESLNKSKQDKSVKEYTDPKKRSEREADLKKQNERANKKVDESNLSETEKRLQKEKNDKKLQDKLDADDDLMKKADKQARRSINKDITKGAIKETGKKAGKDALKVMFVGALSSLLKEVVNGLIRFFKAKSKSFNSFLEEMKKSIKRFAENITSILKSGATSVVGTIVTEIFGPIVSTFKKLASLIKQGINSFTEAISYLKNNRDKPFSDKVAHIGKIVTTAIVASGGLILGEVIEDALMSVPVLATPIPILGTPANIIGMFIASLICGILGAIVLNMIDKVLAKKQKEAIDDNVLDKENEILFTQNQITEVRIDKYRNAKVTAANEINNGAVLVNNVQNTVFSQMLEISSKMQEESDGNIISKNQKAFDDLDARSDDLQNLLDELLN